MTLSARDRDSDVVTNDLRANHSHGFALGRIDLSRHDGGTRLIFRKDQFTQTATRSRTKETNVIGDLVERNSECVQGSTCFNDSIVGSETFEFVGSSLEGETSDFGDLIGNLDVPALGGVEAL